MEPLSDSLPVNRSALRSQAARDTTSATSSTPRSAALREIDALWITMADIYGHKWVSSFGADPEKGAGATWAAALGDLSRRQLGIGIDACRVSADPWPPTLPQFRAMCLGIPTLAAVRLDRDKATPFTRLVWQHLDGYRMRQASADAADRMLREAYELAREHVMRGGSLPEDPVAAITDDTDRKPQVPQTEAERLARIKAARRALDDAA